MSRRSRQKQPHPRGLTTIVDLADSGRGVGRDDDGKAVFVRDALPGEQVIYRPTRRKSGYDEAELATLLSATDERVTPGCKHFGVCGGCAVQHASPEAQRAYKQQQLVDALTRVGGVTPEAMREPITGPAWHYRRRARLGVKYVPKKGGTLVGFRERGAPFIAQLSRCHVLTADVGQRLTELGQLIDGLSIRERVPQIEVAAADNVTALVFRVLDPPSEADHARLLDFGARLGFSIYLQPGGEQTIAPLAADAPALYYDLPRFETRLFFQPSDFVQINAAINARLVDAVVAALDVDADDAVLELFAGLGNLSVPIARRAGRVVAVEGEEALVARGRENAAFNGAANIEHHKADLFEPGEAPIWAGRYDTVVIDPPRAGAAQVLDLVAATGARRVVYCSCHPATLARDADVLVHQHGYCLSSAGVADMFPHTAHVESVAVFDRP
ncbi:23S rRNA (uracil(1939)-C(5))-methyltransferase RlmD [Salinisphaera sp. USBA-960]|uniref:23S rRNA (uracil(1939)-C(5))-methyltransferase RlmD n=1 Tax=Salinisphaera orenii TaxID=856731 RepID=UPI000DBE4EB2|nr:23S rRNA (uracil(1939)-C(5))-methyltransferase RlmD [Salifodinibacter halophilus]NNC25885.1 23S rRNA (uracil(1939)-C(5))-methyltransferase RlmD [Salifodinibacter halophilus]